jgi:hypothetical protein
MGPTPSSPSGEILPDAITSLENQIASLIAVAIIRLRREVDVGATGRRRCEKATPSAELDSMSRP